jgi:hypothetical protein
MKKKTPSKKGVERKKWQLVIDVKGQPQVTLSL